MTEFEDRLKQMQETWDGIASGEGMPGQVPEGIYRMQLQSAELKVSESSDKLMIHRENYILDGEHAGQVVHDYLHLETERGPFFVGLWIEQMGFEIPENAGDIEATVEAIAQTAPIYTGQVKINNGFPNVRVKNVEELDTGGAGPGKPSSPTPEEPDPEPSGDDNVDGGESLGDRLRAFAEAQDLDGIADLTSDELLTEIVEEYDWDKKFLTPEEISLLEEIGAGFTGEKKPKPKPTPKAEPKPRGRPKKVQAKKTAMKKSGAKRKK